MKIDVDLKNSFDFFKNLSKGLEKRLKQGLNKTLLDLKTDLILKSPVDKGIFRSSWSMNRAIGKKNITGSVHNHKIYASVIEKGSKKGQAPWRKAGKRTVESNGRIWSSQAKDGLISQMINDQYLDRLSANISEYVLKAN